MNSTNYKGFTIQEDTMLGYSLFCPVGYWCSSATSTDKLKNVVDEIISINQENRKKR